MALSTTLLMAATALLVGSLVDLGPPTGLAREAPEPAALATKRAPYDEAIASVALNQSRVAGAVDSATMQIRPEWMKAVVDWLAKEPGLPTIYQQPNLRLVPHGLLPRIRNGLSTDNGESIDALPSSDLAAFYHDLDKTMYLPDTWRGRTLAEQSVLVHELVHHLQNVSKLRFTCPQEREEQAYVAQRAWLALFGRDFFAEFEVDRFTLLVRTRCMH